MEGTISSVWTYPVKGLYGVTMPTEGLNVDSERGVQYDRVFGLSRRAGTSYSEWKPKGQFHVCMNKAGLAVDQGLTEDDLDVFFANAPSSVSALAESYGLAPDEFAVWETKGVGHLCDRNKPYVSFLNLASVRWLEKWTGEVIDPRRFRMNVWVEGLEPFVELSFLKRIHADGSCASAVDELPMRIEELCVRCRAIEQSPATGTWDMQLQKDLTGCVQSLGYDITEVGTKPTIMGWYAVPERTGQIMQGQSVSISV